jgi:REP element-mobilizing transposase RayT
MPYRQEIFKAGFTYHIYNRGFQKQKLFFSSDDYQRFKIKLAEEIEGDFRLHAYCLMPNHFHLLVEQMNDVSISILLRNIQLAYAKYFSLKYGKEGSVFGSRFKAKRIDSQEYLLEVVRYIHQNAPKAGLVESPDEWIWSSYWSYLGDVYESFVTTEYILSYYKSNYPQDDFRKYNLKIVDEDIDANDILIDAPRVVIQSRDQ